MLKAGPKKAFFAPIIATLSLFLLASGVVGVNILQATQITIEEQARNGTVSGVNNFYFQTRRKPSRSSIANPGIGAQQHNAYVSSPTTPFSFDVSNPSMQPSYPWSPSPEFLSSSALQSENTNPGNLYGSSVAHLQGMSIDAMLHSMDTEEFLYNLESMEDVGVMDNVDLIQGAGNVGIENNIEIDNMEDLEEEEKQLNHERKVNDIKIEYRGCLEQQIAFCTTMAENLTELQKDLSSICDFQESFKSLSKELGHFIPYLLFANLRSSYDDRIFKANGHIRCHRSLLDKLAMLLSQTTVSCENFELWKKEVESLASSIKDVKGSKQLEYFEQKISEMKEACNDLKAFANMLRSYIEYGVANARMDGIAVSPAIRKLCALLNSFFSVSSSTSRELRLLSLYDDEENIKAMFGAEKIAVKNKKDFDEAIKKYVELYQEQRLSYMSDAATMLEKLNEMPEPESIQMNRIAALDMAKGENILPNLGNKNAYLTINLAIFDQVNLLLCILNILIWGKLLLEKLYFSNKRVSTSRIIKTHTYSLK